MIHKFSDQDFLISSYRLALENNVMLRMVLSNQVAIMKKLELPVKLSDELIAKLIRKSTPSHPDPELRGLLDTVRSHADLRSIQMWEFAFTIQRVKAETEDDPDWGIKVNDDEQ